MLLFIVDNFFSFQTPKEPRAHLFPFMMPAAEGELATLYNQVLKSMLGIHKRTEQVDNLKRIAEGERSTSLDRKNSFRMMIWLVSYYEFFDKKVICGFSMTCDHIIYCPC